MDETALNDLLRKIRNTVKDFENEQSANTGAIIRLSVDVKDNQITVKALAAGGPIDTSKSYMVGNGDREMFIPMTSGGITAADLPLLDEPVEPRKGKK